MTEKAIKSKTSRYRVKSSTRGGAREGAGRPAGGKNKINKATIQTVLDKLYDRTGYCYEDLLIDDFLKARENNDALAHKYHMILANKLMPDLASIEVSDTESQVEEKRQAFADALSQLARVSGSTPAETK